MKTNLTNGSNDEEELDPDKVNALQNHKVR